MTLPSIQPFVRSRLTWLAYAMLADQHGEQRSIGFTEASVTVSLSAKLTPGRRPIQSG